MNLDRYRFNLGKFECLAIIDTRAYPNKAEMMFPNVSHADLRNEHVDPEMINLDSICLAVNTGIDWVLLDTGLGFIREDAMVGPILEEEHIQPRHIIITHLDLDHYGGLIGSAQTPAFPDADVYICRDAWSLFTSDAYYEENETYDRREHLRLIESQVKLVGSAGEISYFDIHFSSKSNRVQIDSENTKLAFTFILQKV